MANILDIITDYLLSAKERAKWKDLTPAKREAIRKSLNIPLPAEDIFKKEPSIKNKYQQLKQATVGASATTLAFFKYLLNSPVGQTAKIIGKPGVVGICVGEFTIIYGTTRFVIENIKTGKKMDVAIEGFFAKWFWAKYYELRQK